jgi:DNA polymerase III subunit epsilon
VNAHYDFEAMAAALEETGDYRVLRRLRPWQAVLPVEGTPIRKGLMVDVETTGLDAARNEIIELAMVPFTYGLDGQIFDVDDAFNALRQPSESIPAEITVITGITDEMVAGKVIDPAMVDAFIAPASLVIAHNASFDRRFLERFCQGFVTKPWACSMTQVAWAEAGYEGTKLGYLAQASGFFYEKHRAVHDCLAAIELLARSLPTSGGSALGQLLQRARTPSWRIWAENSPYDFKDILKARGYRWNADGNGFPKAWYIDVEDSAREAEVAFLRAKVYQRDVDISPRRIDAYDRFSDRC